LPLNSQNTYDSTISSNFFKFQQISAAFQQHFVTISHNVLAEFQPSQEKQTASTVLHGPFGCEEGSLDSSSSSGFSKSPYLDQNASKSRKSSLGTHQSLYLGTRGNKQNFKGSDPINKTNHVDEKTRCEEQESEKSKRVGNNGFRKVCFWQFQYAFGYRAPRTSMVNSQGFRMVLHSTARQGPPWSIPNCCRELWGRCSLGSRQRLCSGRRRLSSGLGSRATVRCEGPWGGRPRRAWWVAPWSRHRYTIKEQRSRPKRFDLDFVKFDSILLRQKEQGQFGPFRS
jgi:hypothetical protein